MATAYTPQHDDPFGGSSRTSSLSWKGVAIGAVFTCEVLEPAKLLHSRNFETNEPDYWDPPTNTQPKQSAVVNVRVLSGPHSVGEERSIWAQKPSNLFVAIAQAQQTAGAKIAPGGTLHLKFAGEIPHENKRYSPIKQYQAKYEPPTGSAGDAFSEPTTPVHQPQYAQPVQPSTPQGWPQASPLQPQPLAAGTTPRVRW